MTELDLLNLARSATQNEVSWFAQMITVNFAMVVAIYYFLSQARIGLKIFVFVAYTIGMMVFLGEMLIEANLKSAALAALKALPAASLARPTAQYVGVSASWLGVGTSAVFTSASFVLWLGILYLLFFWKKSAHEPAGFRP
jgi:hypothetical protein